MKKTERVYDYFHWLCEIININHNEDSYWLLAKALHGKEYYWTVPNDDNRGMDGLHLREKYLDENPCDFEFANLTIEGPCSMLEMLIALAMRADDIMAKPGRRNQTSRWFWEIMDNLGLKKYTDADFVDLYGTLNVNLILEVVLERSYKRNGQGGLFPLKNTKKDQKKVEIWYQMCTYLLENYYADGCFL